MQPESRGARSSTGQFTGKYLSLTSFKRDGTGVATPVWFVAEGDRLFVLTGADSLKVRRILRNPAVAIAPCSATGRLRATAVPATAELLGRAEIPRVEALMRRKYRFDRIFILPIYRLVQRLRDAGQDAEPAALAITPR